MTLLSRDNFAAGDTAVYEELTSDLSPDALTASHSELDTIIDVVEGILGYSLDTIGLPERYASFKARVAAGRSSADKDDGGEVMEPDASLLEAQLRAWRSLDRET